MFPKQIIKRAEDSLYTNCLGQRVREMVEAPVTEDDGRDPDADCEEWKSYENDDNYFQQLHQSDKGIAERSSDPTRGRRE